TTEMTEPIQPSVDGSKRRKLNNSPLIEIIKKYGEKYPEIENYIWYFIEQRKKPTTIRNLIDLMLCENQSEDENQFIESLQKLPARCCFPRPNTIKIDSDQINQHVQNSNVNSQNHVILTIICSLKIEKEVTPEIFELLQNVANFGNSDAM